MPLGRDEATATATDWGPKTAEAPKMGADLDDSEQRTAWRVPEDPALPYLPHQRDEVMVTALW
jgi:hypothetical protein